MSYSSQHSPTDVSLHYSEADLQVLKQRVNFLNKEAIKETKNMSALHEGLVKVIQNKLNHDQSDLHRQHLHRMRDQETHALQNRVRNVRTQQQEQLRQIKECYRRMKNEETAELKALKENNKSFAEQLHNEDMTKKRERIQIIKQFKEQGRSENLRRSEEKQPRVQSRKAEINQIKQQRRDRKQKKSEQIVMEMSLLEKKEKQLLKSLNRSMEYDKLVETLKDRTNSMNMEEFHKVLDEVGVKNYADRERLKVKLADQLIKKNRSSLPTND